ncbi:MAG: ABC transporter ATP-binding protein [Rhodothermales bacterium]|nr:ABC transporter ATP-binding protein [Rhodothermales bacterium]
MSNSETSSDSSVAPVLTVAGVSKSYTTGADTRLQVLLDISFQVTPGQIIAVVGESGTGKSTLLHLLGALDRPDSGSVYYGQQDIFSLSDDDLARFRNTSVGFVFQFHHLLPEFNALENVAMPALIRGGSMADVRGRATELLEALGLAGRLDHRPSMLSGGEQQRVAVARAMMNEPAVILADEPTGNLDTRTAGVLHDEIVRLSRDLGQTFIIATHNPALSGRADRVFRLHNHTLTES